MIAAWMVYTVAISLVLYAGARAADYLARAVGAPTRFVWVAAITAAFVLSGRALSNGRQLTPSIAVAPAADSQTIRPPTVSSANRIAPGTVQRLLIITDDAMRAPAAASRRVDVAPLDRWNNVLLALWLGASAIAIAFLLTLGVRLRRLEGRLRPAIIDARPVLLSRDVGPAVLGMIRSRIVLPEWVLSLPRHERHFILSHELEHASAFDPALLCAAALAIALQPWNAGLWAMFTRLKLAIEADCDRRVLGTTDDVRAYGRLLVAVYQRTTYGPTPYLTFVQRPSSLERRILRMTRTPRLLSVSGGIAALATMVLCTVAWVAPIPSRTAAVRTLEHVEQSVRSAWRLPTMRVVEPPAVAPQSHDAMSFAIPSVQFTPAGLAAPHPIPAVADPAVAMISAGTVKNQTIPCLFQGRMYDKESPRAVPPAGCAIDGDILVLAIDDSHVLIAARDSTDVAFDGSDYLIFGATPGTVPADLNWSTRNGHLKLDDDLYIASPSDGGHFIAFIGTKAAGADERYPDAKHFPMKTVTYRRNDRVKWNVLRQLATAPRCNAARARTANDKPVIFLDGTRMPDGPCFIVDGKSLLLW